MLMNYFIFTFQSMAIPFGVFCGILRSDGDGGDAVADTDFSFVLISSQTPIPVRLLRKAVSDEPSWYTVSWALSSALFTLLLVVVIVLCVLLVTAIFHHRRYHSDQPRSSFISATTTAAVYNPLSLADQYQLIYPLPKMPVLCCCSGNDTLSSNESEAASSTGTNTMNIPFFSTTSSLASAWRSVDTQNAPVIEEEEPEAEELVLVSLNSELSTLLPHPPCCYRQPPSSSRLSCQRDVTLTRMALASIIEDSALLSNVCEDSDGLRNGDGVAASSSHRTSPLSAFIKGGIVTIINNTSLMSCVTEISRKYPHFFIPLFSVMHVVFLPILLFIAAMWSTHYILQSDELSYLSSVSNGRNGNSSDGDSAVVTFVVVDDKTYLLPLWVGIALLFYGFGVVFLLFRPFAGILHNFNEALWSSLMGMLLVVYALDINTTSGDDGRTSLDSRYASRTIPLIVGCICNCRFPFLLSRWFFGMRLPPKMIITTRDRVDASVDYANTIRRQQRAADKIYYGNGRKKRTKEDQRWNGEEIRGDSGTEVPTANDRRLAIPIVVSPGDHDEKEGGDDEMSERHDAAAPPDDQGGQWDYHEYFQQQQQEERESGSGDYTDNGYSGYHYDPTTANYYTSQDSRDDNETAPTWPRHDSEEKRPAAAAGQPATVFGGDSPCVPRRGGRFEYHEQTDVEGRQRLQDEYRKQYGGRHHQDITL